MQAELERTAEEEAEHSVGQLSLRSSAGRELSNRGSYRGRQKRRPNTELRTTQPPVISGAGIK